jgi:hypothetical protein
MRGSGAVGAHGKTVLRDGRTGHVPAEPLELRSVAAIDDLTSVHVDAAHFGDGVGGRRCWIDRDDQAQRRQARAVAGVELPRFSGQLFRLIMPPSTLG